MEPNVSAAHPPPAENNDNEVTIDSLAIQLGNTQVPQDTAPTPLLPQEDPNNDEDDKEDYEPWPRSDEKGRVVYASANRYKNGKARPFPLLQSCCERMSCAKYYIGNMPVLLSKDGEPVVIAGSWWPFCTGITVPLIVGGVTLTTVFVLVPRAPFWVFIIYFALVIATLTSLFFVSCRNPGLIEKREKVEGKGVARDDVDRSRWIWNDRVKSYRPRGSLYCDSNDVVVEEYDHFCPWTGTSIGKKNMSAFKMFVFTVNALCYGTVGVIILVLLKFPVK
mmetsp:Transcript_8107/g.16370  ORF Transcript_8107/g.16370 Transcript_8107/m.16370 type:complete len:278 (+) Transcript_8107:70-903(+)